MQKFTKIERMVSADTNRLYGPLGGAIKYLQEMKQKYPDATLYEHWYGYEDMEMVFHYYSEETDEEFNQRVKTQKRIEENRRKEKEIAKKRQKDYAEFQRLKRKHGFKT